MSPALLGSLIGGSIGLIGFVALRSVAATVEGRGLGESNRRLAGMLRMAALVDLLLFAIIGYFVGPMVFG